VIAEACESDGTLVGYRPTVGLAHNISRDHAEVEALRTQFGAFAKNCRKLLANAACPEASALARTIGGVTYGIAAGADLPLEVITPGPDRARGALHAGAAGVLAFDVPQPGVHNLENAAAAALGRARAGRARRSDRARPGPLSGGGPAISGHRRHGPRHPRGR